jgi:hypothetical protein
MIKPFVAELGAELAPLIKQKLTDPKFAVSIATVRDEIEKYMSIRMETLTAQKVTRLLEFVIRPHGARFGLDGHCGAARGVLYWDSRLLCFIGIHASCGWVEAQTCM